MYKLSLVALMMLGTLTASADEMKKDMDDCIMAKELKVKFINDSTKYVDEDMEMNKINEFKDFIQDTNLYVLIEGHTNKLSTAQHNYELSTRRAVTVMADLVEQGLQKSHVRAMGFGESTPLYSNDTQDGLDKNRRVIAEVFNSAEELNNYIQEQKTRIQSTKFEEQ